jgi:hypothetical protein
MLSVAVDPEIAFPAAYPYSSGHSRALHENFEDLAAHAARSLAGGLADTDLVVDIGANDGTLLRKFTGCRTVGVEPTRQADRITGPFYPAFFTEDLAHRIVAEHGQAKIVTACNVLAHVEDIDDVMRGIRLLLADDGVLIAENHDLASVVGGQWDTVYHEHLRFYSPHSFEWLLRKHDLGAKYWTKIPTHGGSFRIVATTNPHERSKPPLRGEYDWLTAAEEASADRSRLRRKISSYGGACVGIGATARATTIINYCGLDAEDLAYVGEVSGSDKIGRLIPGTAIPVVDEARLFEDQRPAVLFSWHMADVIVPKLREKGYTGEIILPMVDPVAA